MTRGWLRFCFPASMASTALHYLRYWVVLCTFQFRVNERLINPILKLSRWWFRFELSSPSDSDLSIQRSESLVPPEGVNHWFLLKSLGKWTWKNYLVKMRRGIMHMGIWNSTCIEKCVFFADFGWQPAFFENCYPIGLWQWERFQTVFSIRATPWTRRWGHAFLCTHARCGCYP